MKYNPIILPLDKPDIREAESLIDKMGENIDFYKIGSILFTHCGNKIIELLQSKNKKVFLDLKFHDIPNTVEHACYAAALMEVDLCTIHLSGGSEMIKGALKGVKKARAEGASGNTRIIGVSVLTSLSEQMLQQELKIFIPLSDYIKQLTAIGLKSEIDGIVCSPQETAIIRKEVGDDFIIVNPGIRLSEDNSQDQKRIATPEVAMQAGATYMVIGRAITGAADPVAQVLKIKKSISN